MKKRLIVPVFLIGMALPLAFANKAQPLEAAMFGEANSKSEYVKYASEVATQLADEGFVLLKNDGFLPMSMQGKKVSIASKNSAELLRGGTGSGAGASDGEVATYDLASSLQEVGATVNPTLKSFYGNSAARTNGNTNWTGISQVTIGESKLSTYTDAVKNSMTEYGDAIFQVITREGSEGCDLKTCDCRDSNNDPFTERHALELSKNEEDLFNELHNHTDHIIMVINSSNVFECGIFENDPKVSAVIWIGNPGQIGPKAFGRILSGEVNPSGHTVDTWAKDFTLDPTWQNFSDSAQTNLTTKSNGDPVFAAQDTMFNADGTPVMCYGADKNYTDHAAPRWADEKNKVVQGGLNGVRPSQFVSYEEGIYYDYRYYETKYDDMKASDETAANDWYNGDGGVVYPFGYGLSYTTFSQEIVSTNLPEKAITNPNTRVEVKVKVTNTGTVAGKEVVQLYFRAPYESGGIEKASKVLCAFDKTDLLEPNESQELTLKFYLQDFASYDFSDANNNKFKGYELDGGDYQLVLGKNAHEEIDTVDFSIQKKGFRYAYDRYTGNKVENRFTDNGFYSSLPGENDIEFTQMSRSNFADTFPTHPTIEDRTLGVNSRVEEFFTHGFTLADIEVDKNFEYIPEEAYKTKKDIEALGWTQATDTSGEVTVKIEDLYGLDSDDPLWDEFMNQLTYQEMLSFVQGGTHNPSITRLGKKSSNDSDGPQKFLIMWWVSGPITAATYNVDLARKQGECIGMEGKIRNTPGWAGPGVNIHRSPFGGRNFEYYSADPFLTGRMSGRVVAGATDRGIYCFFKHFAVNDQEKGREGIATFINEQALREIYLKAFQLPIQEGKSIGIMSSYNRLGLMETAASYPLLTKVLREEWGFKGAVLSDMTHHQNAAYDSSGYENINNRLLAGCDQQLDSKTFDDDINAKEWDEELGCPVFRHEGDYIESYSWWYAVRTSAKLDIWMNAHSSVYVDSLITPINEIGISGTERDVFTAYSGEKIDIEITLPDSLADGHLYNDKAINSSEVSIDPCTPLPQGLTFANNHITGKVKGTCNKFIHILVELELDGETESVTVGKSFELIILAKAKSGSNGCAGGCNGTLSTIGLTSLLGLALAGVIGVKALRKKNED